jgi:hypothetical protein
MCHNITIITQYKFKLPLEIAANTQLIIWVKE